MAVALLDQWLAAFGPIATSGQPPPVTTDAEPATAFRRRCIMAALSAAISVGQEAVTTTDHANRVALAKSVMDAPLSWLDAFASVAAAQGVDNTSADQAIKDSIWQVWSTMAGAL